MKHYHLWEEKPAKEFSDAHYLGNGRLGFSVFGGVPQETVVINEDSLWSGYEKFHLNENYYEKLMEARQAVLDGEPKRANNIMNEEMAGRWHEAYMPMAELHFMSDIPDNFRNMPSKRIIEAGLEEFEGYRRDLDLAEAVETVSWEKKGIRYKRRYFVSAPAQAGIVLLTAADKKDSGKKVLNTSVSLDSKLSYEGICYEEASGCFGEQKVSYAMTEDRHNSELKNAWDYQEGDAAGAETGISKAAFPGAWIGLTGIAPDHAEPNYTPVEPGIFYRMNENSRALRFACAAAVLDTDGEVHTDGIHLYIKAASYAVIAVDGRTNYTGVRKPRNNDRKALLTSVLTGLKALLTQNSDSLLADHLADYQAVYGRVELELGDELTGELPTTSRMKCCGSGLDDPSLNALYLQYARYLIIAGSRPGTQALNLQGIWNDSVSPAWSSNFTTNINVEMNYWPAEKLNLADCHGPMMDLIEEMSVNGSRTAREYYHAPGWTAHHNVDGWKSTEPCCEDASWFWWPFGGAWMCEHIWVHYEYTKDTEFLRRMYPVLREAANFFLHFLTEDKDGSLVTAPSTSPENKYICGGGVDTFKRLVLEIAAGSRCSATDPDITAVTKASTMDMSILRELFSNVIEAAKILQIEDTITGELAAAKAKFPPYRTGRFGQLLEWTEDYEECSPGMGHISHMYPVYPGNLITEEKTPELFEAARVSLERRNLNNGDQHGWPGAWRVALMARFHNSLECGRMLKSIGTSLGAGLILNYCQQMDVTFGLGAGIGEMLLQSHQGHVELIPAIPVDWEEGSFTGMCARNGFEADLKWKNNCPTEGHILSKLGGSCSVVCRKLKAVVLPDGSSVPAQAYQPNGGRMNSDTLRNICTFETEAGQTYTLLFEENQTAHKEYRI